LSSRWVIDRESGSSSPSSVFSERFGFKPGRGKSVLFAAESLRDWRGHAVIDPEGHKIGILEAVYVDTATDEPCFITVKVGMMSRHRVVFVPVAGATVSPKAVRVQYPKKVVQSAPATDADGELAATAEPEVFGYYNLDYGSKPKRRLARRVAGCGLVRAGSGGADGRWGALLGAHLRGHPRDRGIDGTKHPLSLVEARLRTRP
jgi:hypothetical protein